jgi:Leucine-rich repeat (LRR) protein
MTALTELLLYSNNFTGIVPREWAALAQLTTLDLSENKFSGPLPAAVVAMIELTDLRFDSNDFTGTVPSEWAALDQLTILYLSDNKLSGPLPASWKAMTLLTELRLDSNYFTGTVPSEWAELDQLTILYLSENKLSGPLPASWAAMTALLDLRLYSNYFTGTVPIEWAALVRLMTLDLSENKLSGPLPASWVAMKNLTLLNVSSNSFSGQVPSLWLSCSRNETEIDASWNRLRDLAVADVASDIIACGMSHYKRPRVNLCGNRLAVNQSTLLTLKQRGVWDQVMPLLFPPLIGLVGSCYAPPFTPTVTVSPSSSVESSLTDMLTASHTTAVTRASDSLSASPLWSETLSPSLLQSPTFSASCPVDKTVISNATLMIPSRSSDSLVPFPCSAFVRIPPAVPVWMLAAAAGRVVDVLIDPIPGVFLVGLGNATSSLGHVVTAFVDRSVVGGAGVIRLKLESASIGSLSLEQPSSLVVVADIAVSGSCLISRSVLRAGLRWTIAPLPSPFPLVVATNTVFRAAAATSAVTGNPLSVMAATGMVSISELAVCVFSDVDPLDPSTSPLSTAAVGSESGQYYRGAVVVALSVYGGMTAVALCGAAALWWRQRGDGEGLLPHLATMHFPSVMLVAVGVFGEGLASCAVALIRLGHSAGDVALATASLCVCAVLFGVAYRYTTSGLQVRMERAQPEPVPRWARRLVRYSTWGHHWKDTSSGNEQFKRRFMMFIDGLRLPWWTAVELSSSLIQGAILGVRMNSLSVCRSQQWALLAHCSAMLAAAALVRPFGAAIDNAFLVLSKLGSFITALLVLLGTLREDESLSDAADRTTAVFTGIVALQTVVQILCALALLPASSSVVEIFRQKFRRIQAVAAPALSPANSHDSNAHHRLHHQEKICDSTEVVTSDPRTEWLNSMHQWMAGRTDHGAAIRHLSEAMRLDHTTPYDRLWHLLNAIICEERSRRAAAAAGVPPPGDRFHLSLNVGHLHYQQRLIQRLRLPLVSTTDDSSA